MDTNPVILIVDDVELNRAFLNDMLEEEYGILEAADGVEAIEQLKKYGQQIAVVLLDVVMPVMDGFEVLAVMNREKWIENIPVIMISAETSSDYTNRGFEMGVTDYISRPFDSCVIRHRIKNTIMLYAKQRTLKRIVREQIRQKEKNNTLMVDILSTIVEFRNGESGDHVLRIRVITEIFLEALRERHPEYGLSSSDIAVISNAAALHDIGKIAIPEKILNKPGKLTEEEYEKMKEHTVLGAEMLKEMRFEQDEILVRYAHDICRWHHERWDGNGYPDGLTGYAIPISAQVVSLADVYDALVSERVYKPAYSHEKVMQMILGGECGQFNPELLECLISKGDQLESIIRQKSGLKERLFDLEKISREVIDQKESSGPSDRTLFLLEKERIKYQFLASLSNEILFEYDTKTDILSFSEQGYVELGIPMTVAQASRRQRKVSILSVEDAKELWTDIFETTPDNPFLRRQYIVTVPGGEQIWYEFIVRSLWTNDMEPFCIGFIGKMNNIHNQKIEAARLQDLAEKDSLTGLYNQATARELVTRVLQRLPGQKAALLFLDLDFFKNANDTLGHGFGDDLLKYVADLLLSNIRTDDIAARLGGDEFMVFLKEIHTREDAERKAAYLCRVLNREFKGYLFSASIGVAVYDEDGIKYEELLRHADVALYRAKKAGRGRMKVYQKECEE